MRAGSGGEMRGREAHALSLATDGEKTPAWDIRRPGISAGLGKRAEQAVGVALDIDNHTPTFRMRRAHCGSPAERTRVA
jgi:hypothetical protein